jgi:hypothetical protein
MHGRQGFTIPVGRSIQSLDAMRIFVAILVVVLASSSGAHSADRTRAGSVRLVATCTDGEVGSSLKGDQLIVGGPPDPVCVTRTNAVTFAPGRLRIIPFKDRTSAIQLVCSAPDADDRLIASNANSVALLANGVPRAIYAHVPGGTDQRVICGRLPTDDWETAIKMCVALTSAWAVSNAGCFQSCVRSSDKICVEHG